MRGWTMTASTVASGCWPSATRSPMAAASCSGGSRCSRGRCGRRGRSGCLHQFRGRRGAGRRRRRAQVEAARTRSAHPDARYDLGCLYIGVNDVRALDWDPDAFATDLARSSTISPNAATACRADHPARPGTTAAGAKVDVANAAIEAAARAGRRAVVDLRGFGGRDVMMADHVHPTAFGQVAIAERVVDTLAGRSARCSSAPRPRPLRDDQVGPTARRPHLRLPPRQGVRARAPGQGDASLKGFGPRATKIASAREPAGHLGRLAQARASAGVSAPGSIRQRQFCRPTGRACSSAPRCRGRARPAPGPSRCGAGEACASRIRRPPRLGLVDPGARARASTAARARRRSDSYQPRAVSWSWVPV